MSTSSLGHFIRSFCFLPCTLISLPILSCLHGHCQCLRKTLNASKSLAIYVSLLLQCTIVYQRDIYFLAHEFPPIRPNCHINRLHLNKINIYSHIIILSVSTKTFRSYRLSETVFGCTENIIVSNPSNMIVRIQNSVLVF